MRHLWFLINPCVCQSTDFTQQSSIVALYWIQGYNRWNFVNVVYTSWDKRYIRRTSSYRPPSLIFHKFTRRAVSAVVKSCSLTPKTSCAFVYSRWNFVAIVYRRWAISYFMSTSSSGAAIFTFLVPVWSHIIATSSIELSDLKYRYSP